MKSILLALALIPGLAFARSHTLHVRSAHVRAHMSKSVKSAPAHVRKGAKVHHAHSAHKHGAKKR